MNKKLTAFALILAALFAIGYFYSASPDTGKSREVAVIVNGEPIYAEDVSREFTTLTPEQKEFIQEVDVLDFLIEKKLLLQEAKKAGITASREEIEEAYAASNPEQSMMQQNLTENEYRQRLSDEIKINKLLDKKASRNFVAEQEEVQRIYETHYKEKNVTFEEVEREILLLILNREKRNLITAYTNKLKQDAEISSFI
ncbi:SurA N-terminal domain-containing protein [Candidatus Woesearchaeota archaeon]|nr:SurA N-terminal domain-containing protein [Candidatus Woesearchaeota archaeon]